MLLSYFLCYFYFGFLLFPLIYTPSKLCDSQRKTPNAGCNLQQKKPTISHTKTRVNKPPHKLFSLLLPLCKSVPTLKFPRMECNDLRD
ncbi:hypothetical protein Pfo_023941 [Paulownia fortunei]|nr:hypothetical protein Pfo_023941 [Paulownia fortunei]